METPTEPTKNLKKAKEPDGSEPPTMNRIPFLPFRPNSVDPSVPLTLPYCPPLVAVSSARATPASNSRDKGAPAAAALNCARSLERRASGGEKPTGHGDGVLSYSPGYQGMRAQGLHFS